MEILNIKCRINIRLPKDNKAFYKFKLEEFTALFDDSKIKAVKFGKQDIRGTESITLVDINSCVPVQEFFYNKWELLGFVVGFMRSIEATQTKYSPFSKYLKKVTK